MTKPTHPPHIILKKIWIVLQSASLIILAIVLMQVVPAMRPDAMAVDFVAMGVAREVLFNFSRWEINTVIDKYAAYSLDVPDYIARVDSKELILAFFEILDEEQAIRRTSEELYANKDFINLNLALAPLERTAANLTTQVERSQALIEALMEKQVSDTLNTYLPSASYLPPIAFRFTELPTILIISHRDHIETAGTYDLIYGLSIEKQAVIENQVETRTGMSALIVPIGGLSIYPAMVLESVNASFAFEVIAHEWSHHHMGFFPLGLNYDTSSELRTMNETAANIIGKEIAYLTLLSHFPEWTPQAPVIQTSQPSEISSTESELEGFDFRSEMHMTRIRVDQLLTEGKIAEAESYMENRRLLFLENGYTIRRLNQAYFAFYGSYADTSGFAGEDPVGPSVNTLRLQNLSLNDFLREIRRFNSYSDLQQALSRIPEPDDYH